MEAEQKKRILALKQWLAGDENTPASLAVKMDYRSSSTVYLWLTRGRIPDHVWPRLKKIIGGN